MDEREIFVNNIIKDHNALILEIGPLNRPIVRKSEFPNCFYCDIRSTEEIKSLYSGNDYLETTGIHVDIDTIVDIDYVLNQSYKNTFAGMEKFDYVIASHVMEHVEDIIGFLNDIASILKPEGKFCIVYPDKRYCFDHFREAASFRDAYDVYRRGHKETARMVFDFYNTAIAENNPQFFWNAKDMESIMPNNDSNKAIAAYEETLAGEKQDDVHYWPFTDIGFLKFLYDCTRMNLCPYSCVEFHHTQENSQQFLVALQHKPNFIDNNRELENLKRIIGSLPLDFYSSQQIKLQRSNSQLNQKVLEIKAQNENLEKERNELIDRVAQMMEENEKLKNKNDMLITENTDMAKSMENFSEQNGKLIDEVNNLSLEISDLMRNLKDQKYENKLLNSRIEALETIENSTVWKMTKPIRILLDNVKKLFNN